MPATANPISENAELFQSNDNLRRGSELAVNAFGKYSVTINKDPRVGGTMEVIVGAPELAHWLKTGSLMGLTKDLIVGVAGIVEAPAKVSRNTSALFNARHNDGDAAARRTPDYDMESDDDLNFAM